MDWNTLKNQDELLGYSVESGATQRIQDDSWKFLEGKTISFSSFPFLPILDIAMFLSSESRHTAQNETILKFSNLF